MGGADEPGRVVVEKAQSAPSTPVRRLVERLTPSGQAVRFSRQCSTFSCLRMGGKGSGHAVVSSDSEEDRPRARCRTAPVISEGVRVAAQRLLSDMRPKHWRKSLSRKVAATAGFDTPFDSFSPEASAEWEDKGGAFAEAYRPAPSPFTELGPAGRRRNSGSEGQGAGEEEATRPARTPASGRRMANGRRGGGRPPSTPPPPSPPWQSPAPRGQGLAAQLPQAGARTRLLRRSHAELAALGLEGAERALMRELELIASVADVDARRKQLKELQRCVHPDKWPGDQRELATKLFQVLQARSARALTA